MSMRPRGDEISRPHQFRLRRGSRLASLVASPAPAPAPWAEWFRVDIGDDLDPGSRCQGRDARRDRRQRPVRRHCCGSIATLDVVAWITNLWASRCAAVVVLGASRARSVSQAGGVGQGTVIRVAIVADIRLYREGLARVLERQPNISVVATAATGDGSLAPLLQLGLDVILIDKAMPDSLAAMRRVAVAAPGAKVVSLSVREGGGEGEDDRDGLAAGEAEAVAEWRRDAQ